MMDPLLGALPMFLMQLNIPLYKKRRVRIHTSFHMSFIHYQRKIGL
jgi:hypothetical protein